MHLVALGPVSNASSWDMCGTAVRTRDRDAICLVSLEVVCLGLARAGRIDESRAGAVAGSARVRTLAGNSSWTDPS